MSGFVTVAQLADVPPGSVRSVGVGERRIALANVGGAVHACTGTCPHLAGPLGEGRLEGAVLSCPWHGWQFDVTTGRNEFDLAIEVERYEVEVENGEIRVRL